MGVNSSVDTTSVAPFNGGSAGASFVIQSLDLYIQALVEFYIALYAIHSAENYPEELRGIRDEISKHAILYKTLHLKAFVQLIDQIINVMEYFIGLDCEAFKEHLNNILSVSQICEARTSVMAAIHNRLVCNIDVIKEEAGAQRILAEERFNHYKDINDSAESEKRKHYNVIAQALKDTQVANAIAAGATASPLVIISPAVAVAGVIRGIANRFKISSLEKKVKSRHSAVNTPKCSNDEAVKAAKERVDTIIKAVEDCIVKALEADIEMGRAKEAIDELAGSTENSISEFGTFVGGIALSLNIFHSEILGFKACAIVANDSMNAKDAMVANDSMDAKDAMDANRKELEYFMLKNKAKLIFDKCKEFQEVVPIIQHRLSFLNVIGSDDGNKRIVEEWLTAEEGNLKLSESLIKDDSSLGSKHDFLLMRQRS